MYATSLAKLLFQHMLLLVSAKFLLNLFNKDLFFLGTASAKASTISLVKSFPFTH